MDIASSRPLGKIPLTSTISCIHTIFVWSIISWPCRTATNLGHNDGNTTIILAYCPAPRFFFFLNRNYALFAQSEQKKNVGHTASSKHHHNKRACRHHEKKSMFVVETQYQIYLYSALWVVNRGKMLITGTEKKTEHHARNKRGTGMPDVDYELFDIWNSLCFCIRTLNWHTTHTTWNRMNNKKCGIICTLRKRQRKKITFILYQVDRETRRVLVSSEQTGRTRKKYPLNVTILVRQHPFSCVPLPCNFQFSPRPPTAQLFLFSVYFFSFCLQRAQLLYGFVSHMPWSGTTNCNAEYFIYTFRIFNWIFS